jgi:predicted alpha-1,2-mannosidase
VPVLGTTLQGWVNAYKEGGWLPKWASPGYRGSMVGTMGDVSLADAIVKKIPGFDVQGAYEAIAKDAFVPPSKGSQGMGRECLEQYVKFGYIPHGAGCSEVTSRTLDYLQSDYAIANAAEVLGHSEDAAELRGRAANYSLMFDFSSGFIRSTDMSTGKFTEPFDQFAWGGDYTEAGPWQYRFSLPYDAPGLAELYREADLDMCEELERAQTMAPIYHIGDYSNQIHEMTEMAVNCWGQYEHNNQPVHHMLYMFGAVDPSSGYGGACASRGQFYLRKAMRELYSPTWDMFAGDEDNGEMGAWYVLSALGLYSLSPGTEDYVLGSPLFEQVTISLEGSGMQHTSAEATLVIEAVDNAAGNVYVQGVSWNGQALSRDTNSIKYSDLMKGGVLQFTMGPEPLSQKK